MVICRMTLKQISCLYVSLKLDFMKLKKQQKGKKVSCISFEKVIQKSEFPFATNYEAV